MQQCQQHGLQQMGRTFSVKQMVVKISSMLRQVAVKLHDWWKTDSARTWVTNCGKSVSHILGPVPLLCNLGVIEVVKKKNTSSKGILIFGLAENKFRLIASVAKQEKLQRNLTAIVRGSHHITTPSE